MELLHTLDMYALGKTIIGCTRLKKYEQIAHRIKSKNKAKVNISIVIIPLMKGRP